MKLYWNKCFFSHFLRFINMNLEEYNLISIQGNDQSKSNTAIALNTLTDQYFTQ